MSPLSTLAHRKTDRKLKDKQMHDDIMTKVTVDELKKFQKDGWLFDGNHITIIIMLAQKRYTEFKTSRWTDRLVDC